MDETTNQKAPTEDKQWRMLVLAGPTSRKDAYEEERGLTFAQMSEFKSSWRNAIEYGNPATLQLELDNGDLVEYEARSIYQVVIHRWKRGDKEAFARPES